MPPTTCSSSGDTPQRHCPHERRQRHTLVAIAVPLNRATFPRRRRAARPLRNSLHAEGRWLAAAASRTWADRSLDGRPFDEFRRNRKDNESEPCEGQNKESGGDN